MSKEKSLRSREHLMGVLDWIRGRKSHVKLLPDKIWLSRQAKLAGIVSDIGRALASDSPPARVALLAHFADTLAELTEHVRRAGLDERVVECRLAAQWKGAGTGAIDESRTCLIVVGERHPLRSHDKAISERALDTLGPCHVVFHLSLDDPLLQRFSGEWVGDLLKRLGMQEDEAIEHALISRRVEKAQRLLKDRSAGDFPAHSAEEWFRHNLPTT